MTMVKDKERATDLLNAAKSEIGLALYSSKPADVKEHYLKNAVRYINVVKSLMEDDK